MLSKAEFFQKVSSKDKGILIFLSTFFGFLGMDRFYRGQIGMGILKLITFGGFGIWSFVDSILYMIGKIQKDSEGKLILDRRTLEVINSAEFSIQL